MIKYKLYEKNSVPLKQVEELVEGEDYFNKEGECLRYVGEDRFEFIRRTPLISSELITDITDEHTLKLFWVLSKNMK